MTEATGLKHKAATGMVWSAAQNYSKMFISFVSDIILARLLTPYDFGCIGMLAIFMVIAEAFIDGGFGSALIQKKKPTQEDYSTIFFWNVGMSVLLYTIVFLCAPAISRFYEIPVLSSVLRVQGLVLFLYAFNIVQHSQLIKELKFKTLSIISMISSVVAICVTIFMAFQGFGVWALVAKNFVSVGVTSLIFWLYVKWRPLLVFSWKSFKELFGFGLYMFLTHLVTNFSTQLQGLLIGKVYNPSTMGYFSKASSTEGMASRSISKVMEQVTYPLYAETQDNKVALQSMVKRMTMTLSYITFPLLFILLIVAKPLFVLLYGEKWIPSIPYFQVLCIAGLAQCLQSINFQTISAIGKSKVTFLWTVIKRLVGIGSIVVGLALWGMKGLLCGAVFSEWFAYFVNMGLVSRYVGYKWYRQLLDLLPVILASAIVAILSYLCGNLLQLGLYPDGLVKLVFYIFLYLGWSLISKPEAYKYFMTVLDTLVYKVKKR